MSAAEWMVSKLTDATNWARKFSLFQYPFVTACCGMEFMSVAAPKYDIARFGAEFPRFSPRQADLLIIVGTITERQAPVLRRIWAFPSHRSASRFARWRMNCRCVCSNGPAAASR